MAFRTRLRTKTLFQRFGWLLASLLGTQAGCFAGVAEDNALLWRVETDKTASSYLFATIHSDDPRVLALPRVVLDALHASREFCMEVLLTPDVVQDLQAAMLLPAEQSLPQLISPELWASIQPLLAARGIPAAAAQRLKPWAVYVTLSMPAAKTGQPLDLNLWDRAQQAGLDSCGLEQLSEQLSIFAELPTDQQQQLLSELVKASPQLPAQLEALTQAYLARDLAKLERIGTQDMGSGNSELNRQMLQRLVQDRNQRMLQRALPHLSKGGVFIAVGALHLPGEQGLIELLRQQGYRLTPVY